jgi:hypothetical protein
VSGGAHARDASATLGSLGLCEMPGAGVNPPVRHVPQSVPTGNASGGPWDPLPAPRESGMGRKTLDSRREMGDARDHTAGRVTKVQGASDNTTGGVTMACPLSGSSIGADRSRTAEQLGGTTDGPGRIMGDSHGDGVQYLIYPYYLILLLPDIYHFLLLLLHKYYTHSPSTLTYLSFLSTLMPPTS